MDKDDTYSADGNRPAIRHYRHRVTDAIIVVRGELSRYYALHQQNIWTGIRKVHPIQKEGESSAEGHFNKYILEVAPEQQFRILLQASEVSSQVQDVTGEYLSSFYSNDRRPEFLQTVMEAVGPNDLMYHGRTVAQQGRLTLFVFEQRAVMPITTPWELIELNLDALPIDSYVYFAGRRASAKLNQGQGTVTLWQESVGERRYYVETSASHPLAPAFPRIEMLTAEQLREWYDFQFGLDAPPAK